MTKLNYEKSKFLKKGIMVAWLFVMTVMLNAQIVYVKSSATGANDGTSWNDAYTDLKAAITAAASGSQLWVAAGTYVPSTTNRALSFSLKNGVAVYGGFLGTETSLSQRNYASNLTILSGEILLADSSDNIQHIIRNNAINNTAILDGFVIKRGGELAGNNASYAGQGGGILNINSSPVIQNCTFTENYANDGAAIANMSGSNPVIRHCTFIKNRIAQWAALGAGIYNDASSPQIDSCLFEDNKALDANTGSAIYNTNSSSPVITNCTIQNTIWTSGTGALGITNNGAGTNPVIKKCTFSGLTHSDGKVAIYNNTGTKAIIDSCTFKNITSTSINNVDGIGIFNNASSPKITNSTFTGIVGKGGNGAGNGANGVCIYNIGSNALIEKCTFTDNKGILGGSYTAISGIAIANMALDSSVIRNCTFTGNTTVGSGGVIYNNNSKPKIISCVFNRDTASSRGGAIYSEGGGAVLIDRCIFDANVCVAQHEGGGAVSSNGSNPTYRNCKFYNNKAVNGNGSYGGAAYNVSSNPTFYNCLFIGNSCPFGNDGGGAIANFTANPNIINCTIIENYAHNDGGGIHNRTSSPVIKNSILWKNTRAWRGAQMFLADETSEPQVLYSIMEGGKAAVEQGAGTWTFGINQYDTCKNKNADPGFMDPDTLDAIPGNEYFISGSSPALNAGDPKTDTTGFGIDLAGGKRLALDTIDMGAYEAFISVGNITVAGTADETTITTNNGTLQMIATVLPAQASIKSVTWSVINGTATATIDGTGLLKATGTKEGNGTVVVRATANDGSGKYGEKTITISHQAPVSTITVTGEGGKTTIDTYKGTLQLLANPMPKTAADTTVTWSIQSGADKASLSPTGLLTALGDINGTVAVRATANDGSGVFGEIAITLSNQVIAVSGVQLDLQSLSLAVGLKKTVVATISPVNATDKTVSWSSTDLTIATVVNGEITAVAAGTAKIIVATTDGDFKDTCVVTVFVPATGIALDVTSTTLKVGEKDTLTANIAPINATNKNVTWSSDNTSVATVNNGIITAVDGGSAVITVTSEDGSFTATCNVTVIVPVTGISLNKNSVTLFKGQKDTLVATISPAKASDKSVIWSSDNMAVATVTNGIVTSLSAGSAIITAKSNDGAFTATCNVTINAAILVTGVTLNKSTVSNFIGEKDTLIATITPANATNKDVIWKSDNEAIATVTNGIVTSVAKGTAVITVTTVDGDFSATCQITVSAPVTGVSLDKTSLTLIVGQKDTLTATVLPAEANDKTMTWSSDNETVATVNNGIITTLAAGTAVITVKTDDGAFTATCNVTVSEIMVSGVTLNKSSLTLLAGTKDTLIATVMPANAKNKNVTWKSDNETVVTVVNGVLTAIAKGSATITVTTVDGNFSANCNVTVDDQTSLTGSDLSEVSVFPNPATTFVNVSAGKQINSVTVYNLNGQKIKTVIINADHATILINDLSKGLYMLEVNSAEGTEIQKLIVE